MTRKSLDLDPVGSVYGSPGSGYVQSYMVNVLDPDPDPYKEFTDPQHVLKLKSRLLALFASRIRY